jgi:hypothetical protein
MVQISALVTMSSGVIKMGSPEWANRVKGLFLRVRTVSPAFRREWGVGVTARFLFLSVIPSKDGNQILVH